VHRLKNSVIVLFGFALMSGLSPAAEANPDPTKAERFIRERIARSMILFDDENPTRSMVARRIRGELDENFDIRSIAAYALGPARRNLNKDQQDRYLSVFSDWLAETVTRLVIGLRTDMPTASPDIVMMTGTTALSDDQILVHSRIKQSETASAKVDWRLRQKGDRFLVLDIMIFGVSQANVFRSQFAALMRRENRDIEGLISDLKQINAYLAKQQ